MKILILSDSHFRSVLGFDFSQYEYVLHAGDIRSSDVDHILLESNVYLVRGNCDHNNQPKEMIIKTSKFNILLLHSDLYHSKFGYGELINYAKTKDVDLVVFGHTHIQTNFIKEGLCFINPGAYEDGRYVEIINGKIILH